jgi:spore germination protein KC
MVKKALLSTLLFTMTLFSTACWDNIELNRREIVTGIGVDWDAEKEEYKVSFQYLIHENLGSGQMNAGFVPHATNVMTAHGKTIPKAVLSFDKRISRYVFFHQNRIFVIGEEAAKKGISPILDYFFRTYDNRAHAYVLITPNQASDIISWHTNLSKIPSSYIEVLIDTQETFPKDAIQNIRQILVQLSDKTLSPTTGLIEVKKKTNQKKPTGEGVMEEERDEIYLGRFAVFHKDKLKGYLDESEAKGFLYLTNQMKNADIEIELEENQLITYHLVTSRSQIIPKLEDGKIVFHVLIKTNGDLESVMDDIRIASQENIKILEGRLAQKLEQDARACLKKVQKVSRSDVLGFGQALERKFPKEWQNFEEDWARIFPDVAVVFSIDCTIRQTGLTTNAWIYE